MTMHYAVSISIGGQGVAWDWRVVAPLPAPGGPSNLVGNAGTIQIDTLREEDTITDSRYIITRILTILLRITEEGVWATEPHLGEHALGSSAPDAKRALRSALEAYLASLQQRRERLSEKLSSNLQYLEQHFAARNGP